MIRQLAGSRRSYTVTVLRAVCEDLRVLALDELDQEAFENNQLVVLESMRDSFVPGDTFLQMINHFLSADEIEEDTILAELLLGERSNLFGYLAIGSAHHQRHRVTERLWGVADLILIEDMAERKAEGKQSKIIFAILASRSEHDSRFMRMRARLRSENPFSDGLASDFPGKEDYAIALKCLTLAHQSIKIRTEAISKVSFNALWRTIAYPKVPISLIIEAAIRLSRSEADDTKKIFFDCVRGNLVNHLDSARGGKSINEIKSLIDTFFSFQIFVEDLYFERLDDMLLRFLEANRRLGLQVDYFRDARADLDRRRQELGNPKAKLPSEGELKKIPLAVQRKLAREGCYLDFFVLHPDARIAKTLRHIRPHDIERIMRYRNINHALMLDIMSDRKYFKSDESVEVVLHNPKCNARFAQSYIPGRALSQLKRLSFDVNANAQVRHLALKEALSRANCDIDFARRMLEKLSGHDVMAVISNPRANPQAKLIAKQVLRR